MPIVSRSYGIIPISKQHNIWHILMVRQHSDGLWSFPKGEAELGEDSIQTALREYYEETGMVLMPEKVISNKSFEENYRFFRDNELIQKTVVYFPSIIESLTGFKPNKKEIKQVRWMTPAAAKELIKFESKKRLIDEISEWIHYQDK